MAQKKSNTKKRSSKFESSSDESSSDEDRNNGLTESDEVDSESSSIENSFDDDGDGDDENGDEDGDDDETAADDDESEDREPRQGMHWLSEPDEWSQLRTTVEMRIPPGTDFWRMTKTDECADNAPFYFLEMEGDFEVRCKIKANYEASDDQAGIMIREDEENWIKCGFQMIDDVPHMCATVTHDYSDMSMHPLPVSEMFRSLHLLR